MDANFKRWRYVKSDVFFQRHFCVQPRPRSAWFCLFLIPSIRLFPWNPDKDWRKRRFTFRRFDDGYCKREYRSGEIVSENNQFCLTKTGINTLHQENSIPFLQVILETKTKLTFSARVPFVDKKVFRVPFVDVKALFCGTKIQTGGTKTKSRRDVCRGWFPKKKWSTVRGFRVPPKQRHRRGRFDGVIQRDDGRFPTVFFDSAFNQDQVIP